MPHHTEEGDNVLASLAMLHQTLSQSGSLCTGSDASRFERVDSDKQGNSSGVHLMRHASKKIQNIEEQMVLLLRSHESEF